jgi:hypothetical protein
MTRHQKQQRREHRKQSRSESQSKYSGLASHKQMGKKLTPPLATFPNLRLVSWIADRLPELLWCSLIVTYCEREHALAVFREVASQARGLDRSTHPDITLSGIAQLPEDVRAELLKAVSDSEQLKEALRPLLILDDLPAKDYWATLLGAGQDRDYWSRLKMAVAATWGHQSQEATDCRWARVLFHLLTEQICLPEELAKEFLYYPDYGDQDKAMAMIRAAENGLDQLHSQHDSAWPRQFWDQCLRDTNCEKWPTPGLALSVRVGTTAERCASVHEKLVLHYDQSMSTSSIDARHEAVFGIAFYSMQILDELLRVGNATSVLGHLGLRTILEAFVTLSYLISRDDGQLWLAYRNYGSGQAKLAFLKMTDPAATAPQFVTPDALEALSNEDFWQEYLTINLGHWGEANLRKLAQDSDTKAEYDRYYDWASAYTHVNWAAVRNVGFDLCANPLHRLHRRIRNSPRSLGDVVPDAVGLVDQVLELVGRAYPDFPYRVCTGS